MHGMMLPAPPMRFGSHPPAGRKKPPVGKLGASGEVKNGKAPRNGGLNTSPKNLPSWRPVPQRMQSLGSSRPPARPTKSKPKRPAFSDAGRRSCWEPVRRAMQEKVSVRSFCRVSARRLCRASFASRLMGQQPKRRTCRPVPATHSASDASTNGVAGHTRHVLCCPMASRGCLQASAAAYGVSVAGCAPRTRLLGRSAEAGGSQRSQISSFGQQQVSTHGFS